MTKLNKDRSPSLGPRDGSPADSSPQRPDKREQFRALIEPFIYRARQLGLNRLQIREIIMSIL
jgi:hypothetical protein